MHLLLKIKVFPENMGIRVGKKKKKKNDFGGFIRTETAPNFMQLLLKIKVFPENMRIGLNKENKQNIFFILGGPYGPPQPGVCPKIRKFVNFRPLLHSQ